MEPCWRLETRENKNRGALTQNRRRPASLLLLRVLEEDQSRVFSTLEMKGWSFCVPPVLIRLQFVRRHEWELVWHRKKWMMFWVARRPGNTSTELRPSAPPVTIRKPIISRYRFDLRMSQWVCFISVWVVAINGATGSSVLRHGKSWWWKLQSGNRQRHLSRDRSGMYKII